MGWIELTNVLNEGGFLGDVFSEFGYLAAFTVLFLCGLGLPLPEEVSLIGSGILLYQGEVEFVPIVIVCSVAILLGDSVPFFLGKRYGMSALRVKWVARIIHPERFANLQRRFEEHGNWATFMCRFFPGIRIPGYFLAATMGMSYGRFLLLDLLGVVISVPISIYLGKLFGGSIDKLQDNLQNVHLILAFAMVSIVLFLIVRRKRMRMRRPPTAPAAPPSPRDPGPGSA